MSTTVDLIQSTIDSKNTTGRKVKVLKEILIIIIWCLERDGYKYEKIKRQIQVFI